MSERKWTEEQKIKHREVMLNAVKNHPDSYKGIRERYSIRYKGVTYASSWEVMVKKYLDKYHISNTNKVKCRFDYYYNNSNRTYLPDFYLKKYKTYVEVKGMITPKDIEKWKQFPTCKKLFVITGKTIKKIKYGKGIGLTHKLKKYSDNNLFIDGVPILNRDNLTITLIKNLTKKVLLSKEERSHIIKEALAKSPYMKERRRKAKLRKAQRKAVLDKRYAGKKNSQYGTYWITNGTVNKKWKDSKGVIPNGYYLGRVC